MVKYPSLLNGNQADINRRLYELIMKAESGDDKAIKELKEAIGSETTANTILKRIKDVETSIGTETTANTILKRVKDIETAIGTEDTSGTILYRIKQLEPSG
jgi:hypothetical protein